MPITRILNASVPFPERDTGAVFGRGWWPLQWLHFPSATPSVAAYRLRVDLAAPAQIRLQLSAAERYRFFVDGVEAGTGPERGDALHWRMDAYDLDMEAGTHWLAIEVWALGLEAPKWQVTVPPGLLVIAGEPFFKALSTKHAPWEVATLGAVRFVRQPHAFFTGPRAVVSAGRYPWGWTTGGGGGFSPALPDDHGVCGGRQGADYLLPRLVPATIPLPTHAVLPNGTAVMVDAPPPAAGPADDHPPVNPAAKLADELPSWQAWLDGVAPLAIPPGRTRRALVDLGLYRAAWPVLRAAGAGGTVRLRFAEALYRNPLCGDCLSDRTKGDRRRWQDGYFRGLGPDFQTDAGDRDFRAYEWECGRWLEITATAGPDAPLTLHRLALHDTSFPFHDEGALACDAPELEALRDLCVHTLRVGTHGHYCDCPAYERLQYLGDTRLEILATYCLTSDNHLPARALEEFAAARFADGLLPARHPACGGQSIPPFSLWWIGILHDATFWRDEPERLPRLLPIARGILDAWWLHRAANGLVQGIPGWNFVDWCDGWDGGMPPGADRGPSSVLNWHFVWALRTTAALEDLAGDPELARLHLRRAKEIAGALDATCWDAARGIYLDTPGQTAVSEHAQILALLAGVEDPRRERVAAGLATAPDLTRTTIYFTHYLFEALRLIGRGDLIWQRLGLWFNLPNLGLTTTPEQPEPSRSDCHPWGTHPLFHTVATIAGLRPAARGFAAVELAPLTNIPLTRLALTVPHPKGKIHVELHRASPGAAWQGSLTVPGGVDACAPDGITHWEGVK